MMRRSAPAWLVSLAIFVIALAAVVAVRAWFSVFEAWWLAFTQ